MKIKVKEMMNLEQIFDFTEDDIRKAISISFMKDCSARCVFLDRIVPVKEKMNFLLPELATQDVHCQLFYVDKRADFIIAEFKGTTEREVIRKVVDKLAKTASNIGGGFFPGYKNVADLTTVVVGNDISKARKLYHDRNIRDIRLADGKLIFILSDTEEIKMKSVFQVIEAPQEALIAGSKTIFKVMREETILYLDRVKDNKVKAITNVKAYNIALDNIMPKTESFSLPELPNIVMMTAYHEIDDFLTAVISGGNNLTLVPMPIQQPAAV